MKMLFVVVYKIQFKNPISFVENGVFQKRWKDVFLFCMEQNNFPPCSCPLRSFSCKKLDTSVEATNKGIWAEIEP